MLWNTLIWIVFLITFYPKSLCQAIFSYFFFLFYSVIVHAFFTSFSSLLINTYSLNIIRLFYVCTPLLLLLYSSTPTLYMPLLLYSSTPVRLYISARLPFQVSTSVLLYPSKPIHFYACNPLRLFVSTPMCLYTCTPLRLCASTPVHLYASTPLRPYASTPVHLYASTLLCLYSYAPRPPPHGAEWPDIINFHTTLSTH